MDDANDMDAEAFVQAFVNIVVGACISLGKLCIFAPRKYFSLLLPVVSYLWLVLRTLDELVTWGLQFEAFFIS